MQRLVWLWLCAICLWWLSPLPPHIELLLPSYQIASKKLEKNCSIGWDDEESSMSHISDCHSWYKGFISILDFFPDIVVSLGRYKLTLSSTAIFPSSSNATAMNILLQQKCGKTIENLLSPLSLSKGLSGVNKLSKGCLMITIGRQLYFEALKDFLPGATRDRSLP